MAETFEDLQLKAIDDAYSERIKSLFGTLFTNLLTCTEMSDGERLSIEHFAVGLRVARQAREIAVGLAIGKKAGPAHDRPAADVA